MSLARIAIVIPQRRFLRWHERLRQGLTRRCPGAEVHISGEARGEAWPAGVASLLTLERMLLRRSKPTLADTIDAQTSQSDTTRDLIIDLVGDIAPTGEARVLRALYDGERSDHFAIAALLSGRAPNLAVQDAATGAIVAQGLPSLEAADGLTGGLEAVYSRMIALIEQTIVAPARTLETLPPAAKTAPRTPAAFALRNIAFQSARMIYHLCCHSPHWRVGWRLIDGPGVIETGALGDKPWRMMEDRDLDFAADPFPMEWRGRMGVFYERLDYRADKGLIHFQEFGADGPIGEPVPVLEEPWHLSYPFLVEHQGDLYMLPEASASGAVTLYRCVEFPHRWERAAQLLGNIEAADATILRHGGRFFMTSVVRDGVGGYSDTLAIHHATSLFGPWEEHARRPVLVDARYARPAGAFAWSNGALYRPVQDCSEGYGKRLVIARVDELDADNFCQTPVATIAPGGVWPGSRLHTLNRCGRLECIDGAILSSKSVTLRRVTNKIVDSRAAAPRPSTVALT